MSLVIGVLVVCGLLVLLAWPVAKATAGRKRQPQLTDRGEVPPRAPSSSDPPPGSAPDRARHGKP